MTKQKKKRNKKYTGVDAKQVHPTVLRMEAANRTKLGQWWFERKSLVKPIATAAGVVLVIAWLLFELLRILL